MREQLRQEVLRRFAGAPDTQQARDLRDEILSNTLRGMTICLPGESRSRRPMPARSRASAMWRSAFQPAARCAGRACTGSAAKGQSAEKGAAFRGMRIACAIVWPCTALLAVVIGWYGSWGYAWAVFPFAAALLHVAEMRDPAGARPPRGLAGSWTACCGCASACSMPS